MCFLQFLSKLFVLKSDFESKYIYWNINLYVVKYLFSFFLHPLLF